MQTVLLVTQQILFRVLPLVTLVRVLFLRLTEAALMACQQR